ncbi:MAG: hypothetical protein IT581_04210 [Verrucomicrobiales bacterium]|nr:hypothetical protein [Verrucomicrobiales bacterium]
MAHSRTSGRRPAVDRLRILVPSLLLAGLAGLAGSIESLPPSRCVPGSSDQTFLWWVNGWIDAAPREPALLGIQAGHLVAYLDPWTANLKRLEVVQKPIAYEAPHLLLLDPVVSAGKEVTPGLRLSVKSGDRTFHCVRAATQRKDWMNFPVRIIESGRWVQRFDILQLEFEDAAGQRLPAEGRLEVVAWPDRLHFRLEVTTPAGAAAVQPSIALATQAPPRIHTQLNQDVGPNTSGATAVATLTLGTDASPSESGGGVEVEVEDPSAGKPLPVIHDPGRGWYRVELPTRPGSIADQPDRQDRYPVRLVNASAREQTIRLLFDDPTGTPSITGVTPLLFDAKGEPVGIPVQTSKNWHRQTDRRLLYEGPWFHAFTQVRLPPRSQSDLEFRLIWARWGGVPAASHAQLCLVGWGWNQLWDQAAIGSWGESICYEPDAIQMRCRIDDIRPMMVTGMSKEHPKWSWTHNVGGGDFLVYEDADGRYQPWKGVHTSYLNQGPNLTDVRYSGLTADAHIACRISVSSPRTDDLNRAYHHLRYDVLRPTPFRRLAFYQLGSDRYHWHQYGRMAWGNTEGLVEEIDPGKGGRDYRRIGIPCVGAAPWFSLHDGIAADGGKPIQGAWATRGLVIRSWKARLGGREVPPFASIFGTEAGRIPSANLELSPPPGLTELKPGDYVEADIELLILPMAADDYYGPNISLKASLQTTANTWREMHRQAAGNDLRINVPRGRLQRPYPPVIQADRRDRAEFEITGGLGYLPVTVSDLDRPDGWMLQVSDDTGGGETLLRAGESGQAVYNPANKHWSVTFNVPIDTANDRRVLRRMSLKSLSSLR